MSVSYGGSLTVTIHRVKAIVEPSEGDFDALFQRHWGRVYAVLYRLVGEPAEAEDLALETFWRLYTHPPAEWDADRLGGWLYRVATRLGYNALRSRRRRQAAEGSAGQQALLEAQPVDPASLAETEEQRELVREALRQMKARPAQALILRSAGLTYAEIAAALEIAPGSVGTLLARAEEDFYRRYKRLECGK